MFERSRNSVGAVVLPAVVALSSCTPDESPEPGGTDTTATRSGAEVVANTPAEGWTERTAWQVEEDLRIGAIGDAGAAEEQFGSVASVVSDSRGRIYVLDLQQQSIQVFDRDGTFSHAIGRRGQGPGEFEGAWEMEVGAGDTLTVLDDGNMRYSVYAPDGTFVGDAPRDIVGYGPPMRARLADGRYVDWGIGTPDGRSGPRVAYYPILYEPGLSRADTFPPIRHTRDVVESGGLPVMNWGSAVVASVDREGGIWFAHSTEYRVYRRSLEGDTTLVFSLSAEPAPMRDEDRERVRERWEHRPDIRSEQLAALPDVKPVVYGIVPDNRGHVLVFPDVADEPAGSVVDVFRESGEYLGRVRLPYSIRLNSNRPPVVHVSGDRIHLVVRHEFDVPYVSRLRIVGGA